MLDKCLGSGEVLAGGQRLSGKSELDGFDFDGGSFYPPTVISGIDTSNELWQEEIFGPVVLAKRFSVSGYTIRESRSLGCIDGG